MLLSISLAALAAASVVLATANPEITAAAVLDARQNSDPALVGWVSTTGQTSFSVRRSCDYPATLSRSGSYAQCCAAGGPCNFFTACSAGILLAANTRVYCDVGYCNTGVVVPSLGATGGYAFLGCYPTAYGTAALNLVQDIGNTNTGSPSTTSSFGNPITSSFNVPTTSSPDAAAPSTIGFSSADAASTSDRASSSVATGGYTFGASDAASGTVNFGGFNTGGATTSALPTSVPRAAAAQIVPSSLNSLLGAIAVAVAFL